jgi:predicted dehydrogenase
MMGFCYRFLPSLQQFRESLRDVRVFSLTMLAGAWLPDWHEGDYRERYHGTPGVGGIINDSLSHSLYIARWLMGKLELVGAVTGRFGGLDIATEDTAAVLLRAATGQPVFVLADYLRRPGGSVIEAVTSGGVKVWEMNPDEAPEMYRKQAEVFVEVCEGKRAWGYPNLNDGIAVQELLDEIAQ